MARRSFVIAKAHLLYLHKKELVKYAAENQRNQSTADHQMMFIDVQKVVH